MNLNIQKTTNFMHNCYLSTSELFTSCHRAVKCANTDINLFDSIVNGNISSGDSLRERIQVAHNQAATFIHHSQQCTYWCPQYCSFSTNCFILWYYYNHLTASFPGQPGWAGTRKVKPICILLKQETVSGSGISWAICKSAPRSRQTTTPVPHHSVFYRPDALAAAQPTASKHWGNIL